MKTNDKALALNASAATTQAVSAAQGIWVAIRAAIQAVFQTAARSMRPGMRAVLIGAAAVGVVTARAEPSVRDVTFSVDMSVQVATAQFRLDTWEYVEVRGDFVPGTEGLALSREGTSAIYSGTFPIQGDEGQKMEYFHRALSFRLGDETVTRELSLGPPDQPQILPTVYFNDLGPDVVVEVTVSVDMDIQMASGSFRPDTMQVRAFESVNGWAHGWPLARVGDGTMYTGTMSFVVADEAGVNLQYLFYAASAVTGAGPGMEWSPVRTLHLNAGDEPITRPPVYFADQGLAEVEVTFSVDMTTQIYEETFDPSIMGIVVSTNVYPWYTGDPIPLQREGDSPIYGGVGTFMFYPHIADFRVDYRFCITGQMNVSCESYGWRFRYLQPDNHSVVLPTVYYNNQTPPSIVPVTFSVDMSVLMQSGAFDPDTMGVNATGLGRDWTGVAPLQREGSSAIYSATVPFGVYSPPGRLIFIYKFCVTADGSAGCEMQTAGYLQLESYDGPVLLPTVYFNNEQPRVSSLSSTPGPALTIRPPLGHDIDAVYGADLVLVDGAWSWNLLDPGEDYTLENGEVVLSPEERQVLRFEVRRAE